MDHREPGTGTGDGSDSTGEAASSAEVLSFGPFRFDRRIGTLERDGETVALTPKSQDLLSCLLEEPGIVATKEALLARVWGDTAVTDHSLTEAIRSLRKTLGDDPRRPRYIQTVHRRGYRFIGTVAAHDEVATAPEATSTKPPSPSPAESDRSMPWGRLGWGLLGTVVGTALVGWLALAWLADGPAASTSTTRVISPPDGSRFTFAPQSLMYDPEGSTLLYTALGAGGGQLMEQRLADGDRRPVPGVYNLPLDDGAFSPDGTHAAFLQNGSVRLMSVVDGEMRDLCAQCVRGSPDLNGRGLTFANNHQALVFATAGELQKIPTTGGEPSVLVRPPAAVHAGGFTFPHALPGGEWLLATLLRGRSVDRAEIVLVDAESGETAVLIEDGVNARYVASGHVVFVRHGDLWAVPFDLNRRAVIGEPKLVRRGIMMSVADGLSRYAVSADGDLAYISGDVYSPDRRVVAVDADGNAQPLFDAWGRFEGVRLSPDGTKAAVEVVDGGDYDIRIYDLDGGEPVTLGSEFVDERYPVWSPDGTRIAFSARHGAVSTLYWKRADGNRQYVEGKLDSRRGASLVPQSWSRDGHLAYVVVDGENWDLWTVGVGRSRPRPFLTGDREVGAAFSPDGLWLAVSLIALSDAGPTGIRVVSFPEPRVEVELDSWGVNLHWRPDGSELCFAAPGLHCAPLSTPLGSEPDLRFEAPRRTGGGFYYGRHRFGIAPDGGRFAVVDEASFQTPLPEEIVLVSDWFDELRRLAPVER